MYFFKLTLKLGSSHLHPINCRLFVGCVMDVWRGSVDFWPLPLTSHMPCHLSHYSGKIYHPFINTSFGREFCVLQVLECVSINLTLVYATFALAYMKTSHIPSAVFYVMDINCCIECMGITVLYLHDSHTIGLLPLAIGIPSKWLQSTQ